MADDNNNNAPVSHVKQSYQPKAEKTYSPVTQSGNYQPLIPAAAESQRPTPPVGVSGVQSGRNGGAGGSTPSEKNSSSDRNGD